MIRSALAVVAFILFGLVSCSLLRAQVTQEPIESEPASLVTLESEHAGRWIPGTAFDASAKDRFDAKVWPDRKSAVVASGLPGSVRVVVLIPDDSAQNFVTFTVKAKGTPKPEPPGPGPGPDPNPEPPPGGPKWILFIEETADRGSHPEMAVLAASDFNQLASKAGHDVRWYDDDDTASGGDRYAALLKQRFVDLPAVMVYDQASKSLVSAFPVPKTDAKASLLKTLGIPQ